MLLIFEVLQLRSIRHCAISDAIFDAACLLIRLHRFAATASDAVRRPPKQPC